MDRKIIPQQKGFTLVELMLVVAIVGILAVSVIGSKRHTTRVNQVNNDLHSIAAFMKQLRLDALTQKTTMVVTVTANQMTTLVTPTFGAQAGIAAAGRTITFTNSMVVTGSPFSLSTRGNLTGGSIRLADTSLGTKYSCVAISNIRVRLGEVNGGTCDAI